MHISNIATYAEYLAPSIQFCLSGIINTLTSGDNLSLEDNRVSRVEVLDITKDLSTDLSSSSLVKLLDAAPMQGSLDLVRGTFLELENRVALQPMLCPFPRK
jgi:hypothetical protein